MRTDGQKTSEWQFKASYPCCCSIHFPCTQGWCAQWSVPERHRGPWVLGGHRHWNPLILSMQVPPLIHGFELHSLISTSHFIPIREWFREKYLYQTHTNIQLLYPVSFLLSNWVYWCTKHTCISWGAHTLVLINAILALSILAGVASTVIFIDLTVQPWGEKKIQRQTHTERNWSGCVH